LEEFFERNPAMVANCPTCRVPFRLSETTLNLTLQELIDLPGEEVAPGRHPERPRRVHLQLGGPAQAVPVDVVQQYNQSDVAEALREMLLGRWPNLGEATVTRHRTAAAIVCLHLYVLPFGDPDLVRRVRGHNTLTTIEQTQPPDGVRPSGRLMIVMRREGDLSNIIFESSRGLQTQNIPGGVEGGRILMEVAFLDPIINDIVRRAGHAADGRIRIMIEWRKSAVHAFQPPFDPGQNLF
jgi:hypothetical protein